MVEIINKNKKLILCLLIFVIVLVVIIRLIGYFNSKENKAEDVSKLNQLYETLQSKDSYGFITTLDEKNKMYYASQDNKAYINIVHKGKESEFIVRDGNTYLIMDDTKVYYTYNNNETDLDKIEVELKNIKDLEYENGKEKINSKTYQYEEYKVLTTFTMMDTSEIKDKQEVRTRFYFEGKKLEYIKTLVDGKQELLKVDVSYNVDSNLFEIPSNYKEM